eukprot:EG_transcript_2351
MNDDYPESPRQMISVAHVLAMRQLARSGGRPAAGAAAVDPHQLMRQLAGEVGAPPQSRAATRHFATTLASTSRSHTPEPKGSARLYDTEERPSTNRSKQAQLTNGSTPPRPPGRKKAPAREKADPAPSSFIGYSNMFSDVNLVAKEANFYARESELYIQQAEHRLEELQQLVQLAAQHATPKRREMYCRIPNPLDELLGRKQGEAAGFKLPRIMHSTVSTAMQALNRSDDTDSLLDGDLPTSPTSHGGSGKKKEKRIRLTIANSVMLQMGLEFGLPKVTARQVLAEAKGEEDGPCYATGQGLGLLLRETGWRAREGDEEDDSLSSSSSGEDRAARGSRPSRDRHQTAKLRRLEAQEARVLRIKKKMERRDEVRAMALELNRDRPRVLDDALRAAMWLTIAVLGSHSFLDAPRRQRLRQVIQNCLLPIWRRYMFRRKRQAARMLLNAWGRTKVRPMTIKELRATGPLFSKWPDGNVESFLAKMQLTVFRPGEVICHKGDPSDYLYILVRGSVEVIVFRASSTGKGRGRKSGMRVAVLNPPRYIGEYGVFADEPRSATMVAVDHVFTWRCIKEAFRFELGRLPKQVLMEIKKTLEANMNQIYKVRPAQLASTVLFMNWDLKVLEDLVTRLEPFVFNENQVMVKQGDPGTCLYMIARGKCECTIVSKHPETGEVTTHTSWLSSGDQMGQRGCLFVEPQPATVRAVTTVQAWKLKKSILMDYMLQRPDWFLGAKQRLNREFEKFIPKPTMKHMMGCGVVPTDFNQRLAERIYDMCLQPRIIESTAPLVLAGEEVRGVFLLVGGLCTFEGRQFGPGSTLGVEQVLRHESFWAESIVANARLDVWFFCFKTLYNVLQKPGKVPPNHPPLVKLQQLLQQWKDNAR